MPEIDQPMLYDVMERFESAIRDVYGETPPLSSRAGERVISNRLMLHLQNKFPDLNVDSEYDRNQDGRKTIEALYYTQLEEQDRQYLAEAFPGVTSNNAPFPDHYASSTYRPDLFQPDIIVHRRGINEANLLVIEVKKITKSKPGSKRLKDIHQDLKKLRELTFTSRYGITPYGYGLGLFLYINLSDIEQTKWLPFIDGKISHDERLLKWP